MSELRKRCFAFMMDLVKLDELGKDLDFVEAFAKEQQIKGMEAVRDEFLFRKRHIRKSMMDIMFLKWIDAEIKQLKEGG